MTGRDWNGPEMIGTDQIGCHRTQKYGAMTARYNDSGLISSKLPMAHLGVDGPMMASLSLEVGYGRA